MPEYNNRELNVATKVRVKTATMVGVLAIFGLLGGAYVSFTMNNSVSQNSNLPCEKLSQDACTQKNECQPLFDKDVKYVQCIALSQEEQSRRLQARILCDSTQGAWQITPYGVYCNCAVIGKTYKEGSGCK